MILLERKDVDRLDLPQYPFYFDWDMDDPTDVMNGEALGYPDIPAPGPFMLVVHDEEALAGQRLEDLCPVASKREDPASLRRWRGLADIYAESMGISRQSLVLRYSSMRKQTYRVRGQWLSWEKVYHWPEGGEHAWSALLHGEHPWLEVRDLADPDNKWWIEDRERERQVRYIP